MRRLIVLALLLVSLPAAAAPWEKSGIDWNQVPPMTADHPFTPPKAQRFTLQNGMNVLIVEQHRLPLVSMRLVVPDAGSAHDPAGKTGLAALTADLLDEGAGGLSALDLAAAIDRLGSSVDIYADVDSSFVTVTSLARNLEATADLAAKIVTTPAFDAKEFERVFSDEKTDLVLRRDQPADVASLVFAEVVGGRANPYGHPPAGFLGDVEQLTLDDAKAFYAQTWRPERMTLVVAGDVSPRKLVSLLDGKLGAWRPAAPAQPAAATSQPAPTPFVRYAAVDKPGAEQTRLVIGLRGLPRTDARYHAVEVLTTILGGGFTSRLVHRIREQLGYTYGIHSVMRYLQTSGVFLIASGVFTPVTGKSVAEIRGIVASLAKKAVPDVELVKAKQNLIRALPEDLDGNGEIAAAFAELTRYGLPDDWYDGFAGAVGKVTAKDVQTLAKQVIPEGNMSYVVVGDLKAISKDLAKAGLSRPQLFDADGTAVQPAGKVKGKGKGRGK